MIWRNSPLYYNMGHNKNLTHSGWYWGQYWYGWLASCWFAYGLRSIFQWRQWRPGTGRPCSQVNISRRRCPSTLRFSWYFDCVWSRYWVRSNRRTVVGGIAYSYSWLWTLLIVSIRFKLITRNNAIQYKIHYVRAASINIILSWTVWRMVFVSLGILQNIFC